MNNLVHRNCFSFTWASILKYIMYMSQRNLQLILTFMAECAKPILQYNMKDLGFQEQVKLHKVSYT